MNASTNEKSLIVRCRLIPDFNACAGVSVFVALLFLGIAVTNPLRSSDVGLFAALLSLSALTPLYWLVARTRGAIVLSESGVRWRTAFSRWKEARWDEIKSCAMRPTSTGWKLEISTCHGAFSWTKSFHLAEQLAPFASRFCPKIPAETEDWPRVFDPDLQENWIIPVISFPTLGFWLFWSLWKLLSSSPHDLVAWFVLYKSSSGLPLTLLAIVALVCLMLVLPVIMLLLVWQMWRQSFSRRDNSFVATPAGLTWHRKGRQQRFVSYAEMRHLHVQAHWGMAGLPQYRLENARGELSWNHGLNGHLELQRTLRGRAPQLEETTSIHLSNSLSQVPNNEAEVLVFDFKTRELRAISRLIAFFSLVVLGVVMFGPPPPNRADEAPMPLWFFVVSFALCSAVTFYCLTLFYRGTIQLDSRGIEWRLPFKNRFVPWQDIEAVNLGRNAFLRIGGKKLSLSAAAFHPAHFDVFVREIERRTSTARRESNEISSGS